jgi:hypothetical protein
MRKLYGDSLRKEAGFVKVVKQVASRNAQRVAGKHAPQIRKVVREVKGTFDKVFDETADVVEDFLAKCEIPFCLCVWVPFDNIAQQNPRSRRLFRRPKYCSSKAEKDWSSRSFFFF